MDDGDLIYTYLLLQSDCYFVFTNFLFYVWFFHISLLKLVRFWYVTNRAFDAVWRLVQQPLTVNIYIQSLWSFFRFFEAALAAFWRSGLLRNFLQAFLPSSVEVIFFTSAFE